jgi:hypothetical protein
MWFILAIVALQVDYVNQEAIFIWHNPVFQTSEQCSAWVNENPGRIVTDLIDAYPNAKGHKGIFCAPEDSIQQMYEDGVLTPNPRGGTML